MPYQTIGTTGEGVGTTVFIGPFGRRQALLLARVRVCELRTGDGVDRLCDRVFRQHLLCQDDRLRRSRAAWSGNVLLLLAFAVQHSGMARPAFKKLLAKVMPQEAERATYVLTSSVATIVMMALWQPMGGLVWLIEDPLGATAIRAIYFAGWGIMIIATYLIDHWELFGIRQVLAFYRGQEYKPRPFVAPALYRIVRHPIYLGWLLILWAVSIGPHLETVDR